MSPADPPAPRTPPPPWQNEIYLTNIHGTGGIKQIVIFSRFFQALICRKRVDFKFTKKIHHSFIPHYHRCLWLREISGPNPTAAVAATRTTFSLRNFNNAQMRKCLFFFGWNAERMIQKTVYYSHVIIVNLSKPKIFSYLAGFFEFFQFEKQSLCVAATRAK